jgi:hypothetical protein
MPASRSDRRAIKWASTSAQQSLRVAEDAEVEARERARGKPARDPMIRDPSGITRASRLKADTPTKRDWQEAFSFLMANLDPELRRAVTRAAEELAGEAVSAPRRKTYNTMADLARDANMRRHRARRTNSSQSKPGGSARSTKGQDSASS